MKVTIVKVTIVKVDGTTRKRIQELAWEWQQQLQLLLHDGFSWDAGGKRRSPYCPTSDRQAITVTRRCPITLLNAAMPRLACLSHLNSNHSFLDSAAPIRNLSNIRELQCLALVLGALSLTRSLPAFGPSPQTASAHCLFLHTDPVLANTVAPPVSPQTPRTPAEAAGHWRGWRCERTRTPQSPASATAARTLTSCCCTPPPATDAKQATERAATADRQTEHGGGLECYER